MHVLDHTCLDRHEDAPGCRITMVAGPALGVTSLEVWVADIEPGAALPWMHASVNQTLVIHSGRGVLQVNDVEREVQVACSRSIPRGARWRVVNAGNVSLRLLFARRASG